MKFIINEHLNETTFEKLSVGDIFETEQNQIIMKIDSAQSDVNCVELSHNGESCPCADWAPSKMKVKRLIGKLVRVEY